MGTRAAKRSQIVALAMHGPGSVEQEAFYGPKGTYNFLPCGSKAGKTFGITEWICHTAWTRPGITITYSSPYRNQNDHSFRLARNFLPSRYTHAPRSEYRIELKTNGSVIKYLPGDRDPEAIEGAANDIVILDEASKLKEEVFDAARTTITQTKGIIVCISTPRGQNSWFYHEWMKCQRGEPGYWGVNLPSFVNPYIDVDMVLQQKNSMPYDVYRQYILAEFLEGSGTTVFRHVAAAFTTVVDWDWRQPRTGRQYVVACDLARLNDYSVITVVDFTDPGHFLLVDYQRFPHEDWEIQKQRVIATHERWNYAPVIVDATGVGQPVAEDIRQRGVPVEELIFNHQRKAMVIQRLQMAFEQQQVTMPLIPELESTIKYELEAYEHTLTPSGYIGYSAPRGSYDDSVMSLAMAIFYASTLGSTGMRLSDVGLGPGNNPRMRGTKMFKSVGPRIFKEEF